MMTRTKWLRLLVRDLSEVIRWASRQNARAIADFRYRVINGRESVSFRLIPNYPIRVGTRDIVVICHVRIGAARALRQVAARAGRNIGARLGTILARPGRTVPAAAADARRPGAVRALPWVRLSSPSS
ncbi:MAG: hypothetical protein JO267_01595 [Alphaproteobacteria bacterium]|nr:hypothetical protein [Alphaproteobacteria bacterium]MBV9860820.1 hypothetical protein [Alphaproteobacteria bacterium]